MVFGATFFIVIVLIVLVWFLLEFKRMRHKIVAILLIALILFTYLSFTTIIKPYNIDYKTASGIIQAGKIYLSWMASVFGNLKSITTHAINLDWKSINESAGNKIESKVKEKISK